MSEKQVVFFEADVKEQVVEPIKEDAQQKMKLI